MAKELIQKIVVGSMLVAILSFGAFRWFRFEKSKAREEITFDSDLHDKSSRNRQIARSVPSSFGSGKVISLDEIAKNLKRADELIKSGKFNESRQVLDDTQKRVDAVKFEETDREQEYLLAVGDEIISAARSLQESKNDAASLKITALLNKLNAKKPKG
ncbi:MAG: hypothetical protein KDB79_08165 [Acidobacteria bacterium]|nr:hypothetical protein [Acidobacteriota bacterium]